MRWRGGRSVQTLLAAAVAGLGALAAPGAAQVGDPGVPATAVVSRINVTSKGTPPLGPPASTLPAASASISATGRFVAFADEAALDPACPAGGVYLHDRATRTTSCLAPGGVRVTGRQTVAISGDGRFVAFAQVGGGCGATAVLRHDRITGQAVCVTGDIGGPPSLALSADGRFVAFTALQGVANADGCGGGAFIRDMDGGPVLCASILPGGASAEVVAELALSGDGRFVAFARQVASGGCPLQGVFVHDLVTRSTSCLAGRATADQGVGISGDGRLVTYSSSVEGLPCATGSQVYVLDRLTDGRLCASLRPDGTSPPGGQFQLPSISADGRFVAFRGLTSLTADCPGGGRYARDLVQQTTTCLTVNAAGQASNRPASDEGVTGIGGTGDARVFAFTSVATNLVPNDTNLRDDVFVARLGDGPSWLVTGANGTIRGYDVLGRLAQLDRKAFEESFQGGVRIALGDVNGDGAPEVIVAPGPGRPPLVRVFADSRAEKLVAEFLAYDPAFAGGVFVAACDVDGSGRDAIVTGAGPGGAPHVRVFKLTGEALQPAVEVAAGLVYEDTFSGGVRVGCRALVPGRTLLVTAPGPGREPLVRVFNLAGGVITPFPAPAGDYLPFEPTWTGGVSVAAGIVKQLDLETLVPGSVPVVTSPPGGSRVVVPGPLVVAWTPAAGEAGATSAARYAIEYTGPGVTFDPAGAVPDPINGFGGLGGAILVPDVVAPATGAATSVIVELPPEVPLGPRQLRVVALSDAFGILGVSTAVDVELGPPAADPFRSRIQSPATGSRFALDRPTAIPFSWTAIAGVDRYFFEFTGPDLTFTNPNGTLPDPVNGSGGQGGGFPVLGPRLSPDPLLDASFPPGTYQVRVIGQTPVGAFLGTFSDAVSVVLRASPVDVSAVVVAGRGPGGAPEVDIRSQVIRDGQLTGIPIQRRFRVFPETFQGGVNVGTGDTTGGGGQQVVAASGSSDGDEQPTTILQPDQVQGDEELVAIGELPTGVEGPSGGAEGGGGGGGSDAGGF